MNFYVHYDENLNIIHVTGRSFIEGLSALEISQDIGERFILGLDSVFNYFLVELKTGGVELIKKADLNNITRVDVVRQIYEVKPETAGRIKFQLDTENDIISIYYDGDEISKTPTKFYFTRYDDPSYLKCTFQIDSKVLDDILLQNKLAEWPNPIKLKLDNVSDLSIYGIKGQITAKII